MCKMVCEHCVHHQLFSGFFISSQNMSRKILGISGEQGRPQIRAAGGNIEIFIYLPHKPL